MGGKVYHPPPPRSPSGLTWFLIVLCLPRSRTPSFPFFSFPAGGGGGFANSAVAYTCIASSACMERGCPESPTAVDKGQGRGKFQLVRTCCCLSFFPSFLSLSPILYNSGRSSASLQELFLSGPFFRGSPPSYSLASVSSPSYFSFFLSRFQQ